MGTGRSFSALHRPLEGSYDGGPMLVIPKPDAPPRIVVDTVIGDPPPLTEEEARRALSEPDPLFEEEDPDA